MSSSKSSDSTLKVQLTTPPFSFDPLAYDAFVHHVTQTAVLATLVTQYSTEDFYPLIAESWRSDDNFTKWHFKIKRGLTFSDTSEITPSIIAKSFSRIAFLQHLKGSQNNWTNFLKGNESIKALPDAHPGITTDLSDTITFTFTKPMPDLLDEISFGIYSIVSPNDYDSVTGAWKNPKSVTASYQYKLLSWSDDIVLLEKRDDIDYTSHITRKFQMVSFSWNNKTDQPDLKVDLSISKSPGEAYEFFGPVKSGIFYLYCGSWNRPNSLCSSLENRKKLRSIFYNYFDRNGVKITRSFLPLAIKDTLEAAPENLLDQKISQIQVKELSVYHPINQESSQIESIIANATKYLSEELALEYRQISEPMPVRIKWYDTNYKGNVPDLITRGTGIRIERPLHDLKFMFLSKEGIRLPDVDGQILTEISKENFDYQKVNQLIWDQAVVWPITHMSNGFWALKSIDVSAANLTLPPLDINFIQYR